MSTNGNMTHCEVFLLAGQKKATKGNAGVCEFDPRAGRVVSLSLDAGASSSFFFFLGL